jgi:opacity protein-like surface antigen
MKKSIVMMSMAMALSAPAAFAAQGEWLGGGHAGIHVPSGDYGDFAGTGWVGGVSIEYMLTEMFGLGAVLDYNGTKAKDEYAESIGADDVNVTLFRYGAQGRLLFNTGGPAVPYAVGGLGMYNSKFEVDGGPGDGIDDSSTDFGVNGGLGFMYRPATSAVGFGIQGDVHNVFTEDESTMFFNVVGKVVFSFSDMSQQR